MYHKWALERCIRALPIKPVVETSFMVKIVVLRVAATSRQRRLVLDSAFVDPRACSGAIVSGNVAVKEIGKGNSCPDLT